MTWWPAYGFIPYGDVVQFVIMSASVAALVGVIIAKAVRYFRGVS